MLDFWMILFCKVGNNVEVFYNVRGRAWENREGKDFIYFTSLQGWRVREYKDEVTTKTKHLTEKMIYHFN